MIGSFLRMSAVALTMWLGLAAGTVNAGVPTFGSWSGDSINGYSASFSDSHVSSTFDDWISFSLPAGADGSGAADILSNWVKGAGWNVVFTAFNLYESNTQIAAGFTSTIYSALDFSGAAHPGSYQLQIAGFKINPNKSGGYAGMLTVDPVTSVPEPETYTMMLAGLCLLGFTARRRRNNA